MTSGDLAGKWYITYDDGNHEDRYALRPAEFEVRQCQRAAPDGWTTVGYFGEKWEAIEVERLAPISAALDREGEE